MAVVGGIEQLAVALRTLARQHRNNRLARQIARFWKACDIQECRHQVNEGNQCLRSGTGLNDPRPLHDKGHPQSKFIGGRLATVQMGRPVIGGKDDHRVVGVSVFVKQ